MAKDSGMLGVGKQVGEVKRGGGGEKMAVSSRKCLSAEILLSASREKNRADRERREREWNRGSE